MAHDYTELSAVAVLVSALPRMKLEWTFIDQRDQSRRRSSAQCQFSGASWFADLRRIDVRNPDLLALHPERIAIDNAVATDRAAAFLERDLLVGFPGRFGGCWICLGDDCESDRRYGQDADCRRAARARLIVCWHELL